MTELLDDRRAYAAMACGREPYGDGRAAERIVEALEQLRDGGPAPAPYGSGYRRDSVLAAAGYESVSVQAHGGPVTVDQGDDQPPALAMLPSAVRGDDDAGEDLKPHHTDRGVAEALSEAANQ